VTDSYSLLLILIAAIGLGIPVLLIIVGGVYITYKRMCVRRDGYMEISSSYAEIN